MSDNVIHGIAWYQEHPLYVEAVKVNGFRMWKDTARVWMQYVELRQFGSNSRECFRYRVQDSKGKWHNPMVALTVPYIPPSNVVVKKRDPNALTARQMAEAAYPAFDWSRYDQLEHEAAQVAISKLNHRPPAPLGREEPKPEMKVDNRTEFEKMSDNSIQQQGKALVQAQETGIQTKDDMMKAVKVAYSAGRNQLTETQVAAVALLCWELRLSPNPGLGHVYGFISKAGFAVTVGIYGLINLARRDHEFILKDARDMTDEERKSEKLGPEDIGVMVGIIDMREARSAGELAKLGVAVNINDLYHWVPGTWQKEVNWDNDKKVWKGDNIPAGWTARMVAEKRATKLALRRLGLNTNVGKLPEIPGYRYDDEEQSYIEENPQVTPGESAPAATPAPEPIEATFEEMLSQQVQAEQARESAAQQEPTETTPETTEAKTEAPVAAAESSDEKPALRNLRDIYEAGKAGTEAISEVPKPARIVAMFQNVVKPQMSQEGIGDAIKALITNSTLNHVTTEEWRGLLAVINAAPSAEEVRALGAAPQAAGEGK